MSEKGRVDEDFLGAEYVAGRELAALGGFWFEFAERLGQIGEQQSRWLMEDLELSAELRKSLLHEKSTRTELFKALEKSHRLLQSAKSN